MSVKSLKCAILFSRSSIGSKRDLDLERERDLDLERERDILFQLDFKARTSARIGGHPSPPKPQPNPENTIRGSKFDIRKVS